MPITAKQSHDVVRWPDNMRESMASQYTGISRSTLAKLRMEQNRGLGPPFIKVAGCIVYRRADLDAWLESHLVTP